MIPVTNKPWSSYTKLDNAAAWYFHSLKNYLYYVLFLIIYDDKFHFICLFFFTLLNIFYSKISIFFLSSRKYTYSRSINNNNKKNTNFQTVKQP